MAGFIIVITDFRHGVVGGIVSLPLIPKIERFTMILYIMRGDIIYPRGHAIYALGM